MCLNQKSVLTIWSLQLSSHLISCCSHTWWYSTHANIAAWKQFVLTWYNVQWKWSTGASVSTCACNCGSIAWGSCTKAQRGNQATMVSIIAHNFCSKLIPQGGRRTRVVHGLLSKCFISPEKSSSLSSTCEGDFLQETSISSRDTASQYQTYGLWAADSDYFCKSMPDSILQPACTVQRNYM